MLRVQTPSRTFSTCSSVGRALRLGRRGREFKSLYVDQIKLDPRSVAVVASHHLKVKVGSSILSFATKESIAQLAEHYTFNVVVESSTLSILTRNIFWAGSVQMDRTPALQAGGYGIIPRPVHQNLPTIVDPEKIIR